MKRQHFCFKAHHLIISSSTFRRCSSSKGKGATWDFKSFSTHQTRCLIIPFLYKPAIMLIILLNETSDTIYFFTEATSWRLSVITQQSCCQHLRSNDTESIQVLEPEKHCLELTPVCYVSISQALLKRSCALVVSSSRFSSLHFALVLVYFTYFESLFLLLTFSCVVPVFDSFFLE